MIITFLTGGQEMHISRWASLGAGLFLLVVTLLTGVAGSTQLSPLALFPAAGIPTFVLPLAGFLAGVLLTIAALWPPVDGAALRTLSSAALCLLVILLFGTLMIVAATTTATVVPPVRAGLVFLLGTLALVASARTFDMLREGKSIQFETNWGGLGGAMGGWRLSGTAAFAGLAVIFSSTALAVALFDRAPGRGDPVTNRTANVATANEAQVPAANGNGANAATDATGDASNSANAL